MYDHSMGALRAVGVILAGGRGKRLAPLTRDRTKGAVPFGGIYRLIDFTLSNALHSGLRQLYVLPQYKYASLKRHLKRGWNLFRPELEEGLTVVPPQEGIIDGWYRGTADAVHLNRAELLHTRPDRTVVLSSDHVYRMDYAELVHFHAARDADLTIACADVEIDEAYRFGILDAGAEGRIHAFEEKPRLPSASHVSPGRVRASMGIYVFDTACLEEALGEDAARVDSTHDFGHDVIPWMIASGCRVYAWDASFGGEPCYWRDIGIVDAYWRANMDLLGPRPAFDLWDPRWPLLSHRPPHPPARVIEGDGGGSVRCALLAPGCVVDGATVRRSILSPDVWIEPGARVLDSVLLDGVRVGAGAHVERCVIDKRAQIGAGARVGGTAAAAAGPATVTPAGITVLPKEAVVPSPSPRNSATGIDAQGLRLAAGVGPAPTSLRY